MNLKNFYWYFPKALPERICNDIIKYGNMKNEKIAITGKYTEKAEKGKPLSENEIIDLKKKRDSNIVWLDENWIYKEIHPYIRAANINAGWNFEWDWTERCQFTKYKLNQHYGWHCDSWNEPYAMDKENVNIRGKIRKLSMTICLSDEKDYKGGEFEFQPRFEEDPNYIVECKEVRQKGSIVVFPSFIWHRVKAVTEGTRYSLVVWNLGKPFV